jgi:hypothetical protein
MAVLGTIKRRTANFGSQSDYLNIGATGLVTMQGAALAKLQLRPQLVQTTAKASGTPTQVTRGLNVGYSLPVWNASDEELYCRLRIPNRWDGSTDPQFGICTTLMNVGGEDVGDKFKFQLEWQTSKAGDVMGTTTSNCVSEQTVLTGRNDQYDTYFLFFTMNADDTNNPIVAGRMMQCRLRQIAASSSAVTGEIAVWDWVSIWPVNKMYPVWSVEVNAT